MELQPSFKVALAGVSLSAFTVLPLSAGGPSALEDLAKEARQEASEEIAPLSPQKEKTDKTPKPADPPQPEAKPVPPVEVAEEPKKVAEEEAAPPKVDIAERVEVLGLLSKVSPKAAGVFSFSNGALVWQKVNESAFGELALEQLLENEIDFESPDGPGKQLGAIFGEQFIFVVGEGTPEQTKNLIALNQWNDKFQAAQLMDLFGGSLFGGALSGGEPFGGMKLGLQNDPDFLVNALAASEMPPILLAAKVSDEDMREELSGILQEGVSTLLLAGGGSMPFLTEESFEAGGISFQGIALDGEGLIDTFGEMMNLKQSFELYLDPAAAQDAVNTLKQKDLVLATGTSEEGIFLYLGSRAADVPLVQDGEKGISSSEHLEFVDPYLDKNLLGVNWVSDDLVNSLYENQVWLGNSIDGLLIGLDSNTKLGETEKLKKLLNKVTELEASLLKGFRYQSTGNLSYLSDEGLHGESFGGAIDPSYDWTTPFAIGTNAEDVFMTIQAIENREVGREQVAYLEALGEAGYELAVIAKRNPILQEEMAEYVEGFETFDKMMKTDAIALWKGMRGAENGFGVESVLEVDLNGTWPTVPQVPAIVIEEGAAPRISLVRSVTDPAALKDSWKEVEAAAGKLLKTVGEQAGQNIPMQKPMSSTSDGFKTWFYPIPMQTDDFSPSLTVDEEFAIFSTSKNRALELTKFLRKEPAKATGVKIDIQFESLQKFLQNWLSLLEQDPEGLLQDESARAQFLENKDDIKRALKALEELDSYSCHTRLENGSVRSSSHLKTK